MNSLKVFINVLKTNLDQFQANVGSAATQLKKGFAKLGEVALVDTMQTATLNFAREMEELTVTLKAKVDYLQKKETQFENFTKNYAKGNYELLKFCEQTWMQMN